MPDKFLIPDYTFFLNDPSDFTQQSFCRLFDSVQDSQEDFASIHTAK